MQRILQSYQAPFRCNLRKKLVCKRVACIALGHYLQLSSRSSSTFFKAVLNFLHDYLTSFKNIFNFLQDHLQPPSRRSSTFFKKSPSNFFRSIFIPLQDHLQPSSIPSLTFFFFKSINLLQDYLQL